MSAHGHGVGYPRHQHRREERTIPEDPQAMAHHADLVQHYLAQIRDGATKLLEHPCPSSTHFRDSVLILSVVADQLYALVAPATPPDPDALEGPRLEEEPPGT